MFYKKGTKNYLVNILTYGSLASCEMVETLRMACVLILKPI